MKTSLELTPTNLNKKFIWKTDISPVAWDQLLAKEGGHPLQSALWGNARKEVDRIIDYRWAAFLKDELVWIGRFEERSLSGVGKVAWIPKGPIAVKNSETVQAQREFISLLRDKGYMLVIFDPCLVDSTFFLSYVPLLKSYTILIDLNRGKEDLWRGLDKQWRYGVRAAARAGVVIEQTKDMHDIANFYSLCTQLGKKKGFEVSGSQELIAELLKNSHETAVQTQLFVVRCQGKIASGAVILKSGRSIYYFWGATDRSFSKQRVAEAVQWGVIEWALEQGVETYDLGGIDPIKNPGVYTFKSKMGGKEVSLSRLYGYPLNMTGQVVLKLGRWLKRF